MNFILVSKILIVSLMVSGCSATAENMETKTDISKLKRQACDDWTNETKKAEASMTLSVAKQFQEIAEQDDRYTELSRAAFYLVIMGKSQNLLNELKPKWFESFAEVYRHCTSNEFLSFDPDATPSP
jgi:hypothetical protein